jgi:uncharacterized protein
MTDERATPEAPSAIVVRRRRWELPDDLTDVFAGDLREACDRVALSLALPYLEPYLIRTLRSVTDRLPPALAADVAAFCAQEAHHHRNHARANAVVRRLLGPVTGDRLAAIEAELDADYRRFSETRSERWNVAYAEGFEAMTCAMAITSAEEATSPPAGVWQQLWAWHLAEEIEHRTVTFDVYEQVGSGWAYRAVVSARAQLHIRRHLARFHRVLLAHHGMAPERPYVPRLVRRSWRRQLATYGPGYDPAAIEPPPVVDAILATL